MPPLLQVFLEAFGAALLVPLSSEPLFFALIGFGEPILIPAFVAVAGAMAAQVANFAVGLLLLHLKKKEQIFVSEQVYASCAKLGRGPGLVLLLFTWLDFGSLLTVAAAFFNVPAKLVFPVLLLGQAGYYFSHLAF